VPFTNYVELTDAATIRALSHPARAAILSHLHEDGPATATEVSELVGLSPSGCSYHLRMLAKLGFVTEESSGDGRERRWRLAVRGFGIPKDAQDSPEVLAAARLWSRRWLEKHESELEAYLADEESFSSEWRKAATLYASTLHLTPDQVLELGYRYLAMLQEHEKQEVRGERPPGSRRVHLSFTAVPAVEGGRRARRNPAGQKRRSVKKRRSGT
jgi:DNA-binding transcriptional ArsR family regulator